MLPTTKKIVLVTGANSGLGFHACLNIAKQDNYHIILTGRDTERVHAAAVKVRAVASSSSSVEEAILDLSSLVAVKKYAEDLKRREDVPQISALLLNAGILSFKRETSVDGYEATFAVNHLGHFLLATLLHEKTKRLVIISSETHDPAEKAGFPDPDMSDLERLAMGLEDTRAAYPSSKLCNLLFMFEWLRRFPNDTEFVAYTPGFTPDTGAVRYLDAEAIAGTLTNCEKEGIPTNTSDAAGAFMARLVMEDWKKNGWKNGDYFRKDCLYHTSQQARDAALGQQLWEKSEELVNRALAKEGVE